MKFILYSFLLLFSLNAFSQKPALNDTTYLSWPEITKAKINKSGTYLYYDLSTGSHMKTESVIKSTYSKWEKQFQSIRQLEFSEDGQKAFFIENKNLIELKLGADQQKTLAICKSFKLFENKTSAFLIYQDDTDNKLKVQNLKKHTGLSLSDVKTYKVIDSQKKVLATVVGAGNLNDLKVLDLESGQSKNIYSGIAASNIILDPNGNKIAFITQSPQGMKIWLYNLKDSEAAVIYDEAKMLNFKIAIDKVFEFSPDGKKIYCTTASVQHHDTTDDDDPEIWSYEDKMLYPEYKENGFSKLTDWNNLASIDVATGRLKQLLSGDEHKPLGHRRIADQFVFASGGSKTWSYYVFDEKSDSRIPIETGAEKQLYKIQFSPDGRFVVYCDENGVYKCLNIKSRKNYDFTAKVRNEIQLYDARTRSGQPNYKGIAGWIKGTHHVVMEGMYAVWELDVTAVDPPKKLTPDKIDTTKTMYSFCKSIEGGIIDPAVDLFLYGVNRESKSTSIYQLNIKKKSCRKLYEGDFYWQQEYQSVDERYFQKAENDVFLLRMPQVERTPNLLITRDFKQFDTITHLAPEKKYNWLSSELHNYKDSAGNSCQGILYKPENFNPQAKYPVIFYFYQVRSHELHKHLIPEPPFAGISIPILVSNGYLVFVPDIYIDRGKFGDYLMLSIHAAADHLAQFSWIEKDKMAISGHSYGGYEVNYIVSHTSRFAAAISGAGFSSIANNVFDLGAFNEDIRPFVQNNSHMGIDFERDPQLYIDNSPIFKTKDVVTPLLLIHGQDDKNVPFYHSMQFFESLRHLEKKVWLLSYKNGGHGVGGIKNRIDYYRKTKGFFDYYLKDEPIPAWMKKHINF